MRTPQAGIPVARLVVAAITCLLCVGAAPEPVQLTRGPGNDLEAAWSPDGRSIVFQTDAEGNWDLRVLNVATGAARPLVAGPGDSVYPAWSPDGRRVVYSFAHFTRTAAQGLERGFNLMEVPAAGGAPQRLTDGLVRDYTPAFSPDGRHVYFASTREAKKSSVGVFRLPVPRVEGAPPEAVPRPEPVIVRDADDYAMVQPSVSPDGRFLAFGLLRGMRSNWAVCLAKVAQPDHRYLLTDPGWPCYGPRWSPDGRWLAGTGYRPGDAGWGLYVVQVSTGGFRRLDVGPGNSRSPAWSPDGKQLAFENNRTGRYTLYRVAVSLPERLPGPETAEDAAPPVLQLRFDGGPAEVVKDLSGQGNDGRVIGSATRADGAISFAPGSCVTVAEPRGCDFGRRPFSVRAELLVERHDQSLRMVAVGDYPNCRRGWQLYLDPQDRLWFNARASDQLFIGACTEGPLPVGERLTVTGTRSRTGLVELFVNGAVQPTVGTGATLSYPRPTQIRLGLQFDGTMPGTGIRLYSLEVHPRVLLRGDGMAASLEEFLKP